MSTTPTHAPFDWEPQFTQLWHQALARFSNGRQSANRLFEPPERAFLASIGCTEQELFDFIEDHEGYGGDPTLDTVLAVQRIRFRYLTLVPDSLPPVPGVNLKVLPAKTDAVDGIAWLPRLIAKARLKLRGELPPELMYGCGGDRPFLRKAGITLPEFLQMTWDSGTNDRPVIDAIRRGLAKS